MLDEVQLFVACPDDEVLAFGHLVRAFGAERRIGQHRVVAPRVGCLVDGVAKLDVGFDLVQIEIHQGEPTRTGHEFLAVVGRGANTLGDVALKRSAGLL